MIPTSCINNKWMILYSGKVWQEKTWRIYSFQAFGEKKYGELIDQPKVINRKY